MQASVVDAIAIVVFLVKLVVAFVDIVAAGRTVGVTVGTEAGVEVVLGVVAYLPRKPQLERRGRVLSTHNPFPEMLNLQLFIKSIRQ